MYLENIVHLEFQSKVTRTNRKNLFIVLLFSSDFAPEILIGDLT